MRHLQHLKLKVDDQWELVDEGLRKRHDMVPNLIETIRAHMDKGELVATLIKAREEARRKYNPDAKKIEFEHELTDQINAAFALKKESNELARDTNFLELKREIDDIEQNTEDKVKKYNEMVRYYNKHRKIAPLLPVAKIAGFKSENIFEMEV